MWLSNEVVACTLQSASDAGKGPVANAIKLGYCLEGTVQHGGGIQGSDLGRLGFEYQSWRLLIPPAQNGNQFVPIQVIINFLLSSPLGTIQNNA